MSFVDSSAVISATTKWIGRWLLEEGKYLYDVGDHVRHLQDELECMLGHLEGSDRAQQHGEEEDPQFAIFTKSIWQIAFDAEDVIDTYILQVASKMEGRSALTRCFRFLVSTPLIHQTPNQIDSIIEEAKAANERLGRYSVGGTASSNNTTRGRGVMLETYGHNEDEIVVGFDDYIQTLVEQLTNANKSRVIGIVGAGGAGKTTLARKVFHHPVVSSYFKHKTWVLLNFHWAYTGPTVEKRKTAHKPKWSSNLKPIGNRWSNPLGLYVDLLSPIPPMWDFPLQQVSIVSQQWNRKDVLYEILRSTRGINNENEKNWGDRELIDKLYCFLERSYLIVLDDIWEREAWDDICNAIPSNHKGSCKIILTTRMAQVPSYADPNCFVLEPRLLDDEESWGLFREIAIGRRNAPSADIAEFEILGKEMVVKCGGLPLAIVTLAGLLRSQDSLDAWERINKACGDTILKDGGADRIIALSYHNLPFRLKPCFLYLGVYPEDAEIRGTWLTQLWIAEGLITEDQQCGQEILEDVARRCLDELVRRCILQVVRRDYTGIAKGFRLHDLLRDFCIARAKEQSFLQVFSPMDQSTLDAKASLQARRATFHSGISLLPQNPHLRSLIHYVDFSKGYFGRMRMSMNLIYKNFKVLRVLYLCHIETPSGELSKEIGNLIHLRYLAIQSSNFKMFPKAIGNLRNLLTLDLRSNSNAKKIAFSVSNMSQLRHLYLDPDGEILAENFGLDKLKGLQILKGISPGNWMIKEMYALSRGIKQLEIHGIGYMEQLEAMYQCLSSMLDSLRTISLHWYDGLKFDLENYYHLKELILFGPINGDNSVMKLFRFPPNIVYLIAGQSYFQGQDWITALGRLQHLKFLDLYSHAYEGTQLNVGTSAFPQLEKLSISRMHNLEEWRIEEGAFPCLKELSIHDCPKLQGLPQGLRAITTLQQLTIGIMPPTFCTRLGWQESDGGEVTIRNSGDDSTQDGRSGEDFLFIQHVPTIHIRDVCEKTFFRVVTRDMSTSS